MHPPSLETAVRRIRSLTAPDPVGLSDPDLLARFRTTQDDRAFAALVARHGPAVLGVCRRILADPHAAEDAFQAAFLVLARRASSIKNPAAVGCWLHGVAVRVAAKLRARRARHKTAPVPDVPATPRDDVLWRDVRRVLDEEVNRLPERLRLPVLLCYFEGKTRDEAAAALGWKPSTLRGRLEDGRQRLRARLARRGIELSAALLAVSAAADGLAVGESLLESTVRAAGGAPTEAVKSLARGVAMSGVVGKAKVTAGVLLLAVGLGTTLMVYRGQAGQPPNGPGPGPKAPDPPPAEKKVSPELLALMPAADRVWVVDPPTEAQPVPEPAKVLKGSLPLDPGYSFRFNVEALKELPRKGHKWVVFLRSIDEADHIPKVTPLPGDRWYVPADDATLKALREYVPPCEWGEASGGLRLGLWPRPGADEPTVEVVLQNVGDTDLTIRQFRGNYFDEWPHLTFGVTKSFTLERQGGPHKDSDAPTDRVLKAGGRYIHVVRLNRWLSAPDRGTAGNAPPGLFAGGGDFTVQATYKLTDGRDPPRWWIGKLESKPVTVTVPKAGDFGGDFGGFSLRLHKPGGVLRAGDLPELVCDLKYGGKEKRAVYALAENAGVELDGLWYHSHREGSFGGRTTEVTPGSEHPNWLTVRPDAQWMHLRDKPDSDTPAVKEAVPFRLPAGKHTLRVAYTIAKDLRVLSNPVTIEVGPDGWGEASGGVKARLRLPKTKLKPGDPLEFELDLKNEGKKAWTLPRIPFSCEVYLGDVLYTFHGQLDYKAAAMELKAGGELAPFVTGTVDQQWMAYRRSDGKEEWKEIPPAESVPFRLPPGKHQVRIAFPVEDKKVRPVSQAVEVEVAAPALSGTVRALALGADRVWVVPAPTKEKPVPVPEQVLKGPPADRPSVFDLRLLPGTDPKAKFIVFLLADESKAVPEVTPWHWSQWHIGYDAGTAEAIRQLVQPAEWGSEVNGLRLGLRLRQSIVPADGPVAAEITVGNVGKEDRKVAQHRLNIYDYWPRTRFEVTAPGGSKWVLEKPSGPMDEDDMVREITLKPGESYTHAVRLDRWRPHLAIPKDGEYGPNLFVKPGEYAITCRYGPLPGAEATEKAGLASNTVKLTVSDPTGKDGAWGEPVGGLRARLRLPKTKFQGLEPFSFELDLKNTGDQTYETGPIPFFCEIELDGTWYTYQLPIGYPTSNVKLAPGKELVPFVTVKPDAGWAHVPKEKVGYGGGPNVPFVLNGGKHTIRAAYPLKDKVKPVSPPVAFEVTVEDAKAPDLPALAAAADRIVVAKIDRKDGTPRLGPTLVLKGPNNRWQPDVQPVAVPAGAEPLPADKPDQEWVLFLTAEEDGVEVPKLSPAAPKGWFRPHTPEAVREVLAALPRPKEQGKELNGVSLALRPAAGTIRVGDAVRLDVVLSNHHKDAVRVLQQRYNVYDYWPFLTFTVTLPAGEKVTLGKPEGEFTREDFVGEYRVPGGQRYTHVVRLDRWQAFPRKQTKDLGLPDFPFRRPGKYQVTAAYMAPAWFKNVDPQVPLDDWPFWAGELTSNTVTVEVKSPFDEARVEAKPGQVPLLWLVLTHPKADADALADLVVRHADAAVGEADARKFTDGNVVFLVRESADQDRGYTSGFGREQLEEIRKADPAKARRLAGVHAWSLGKLPK